MTGPSGVKQFAIDWKAAQRHVDIVAGQSDPTMCFQTFADQKTRRIAPQTFHGQLSDKAIRAKLERLNRSGAGIFTTPALTDGKGRTKANIVAVRCVFADFDGTPLPSTWPVEPDLLVETSKRKFHVYWLIEQSRDLQTYTKIQKAIAERFGSDASVNDPPRVLRLAGFFHHKGDAFQSRIVRSRTPDAVRMDDFARKSLEALATVFHAPAPPEKPQRTSANAGAKSRLRTRAPTADAETLVRAKSLIDASASSVSGAGGNTLAYTIACELGDLGLSETQAADLMLADWNARCKPPWSSPELREIIANAYRYRTSAVGQGSKKKRIKDWTWVAEAKGFVHDDGQTMYDPTQFKSMKGSLSPTSDIITDIFRDRILIRKVDGIIYKPRSEPFLQIGSKSYINLWRENGIKAAAGEPAWFLNHIAALVPNPVEREYLLDFLAALVQTPEQKILFALLLLGKEGVGKSAVGLVMKRIFGSQNVSEPSNDEVAGIYTGWMERYQLAIIEELMAEGRWHVFNKLKTPITQSTLRINKKNWNAYSIPNHLNFMAFTNHRDAIPLSKTDRRFLVINCEPNGLSSDYFDNLFRCIDDDQAIAAVHHYLLHRTITMNVKGPAPFTRAKQEMQDLSLNDSEAWLQDQFEALASPFNWPLVRIEDIDVAMPPARTVAHRRRVIAKFLMDRGYQKQNRDTNAGNGRSFQLWSKCDHDVFGKMSAKARYEFYDSWRYLDNEDNELDVLTHSKLVDNTIRQ